MFCISLKDLSDLMVKGEGHFKVTSKECTHPKPFQGHIVIHSPFKEEEETERYVKYGRTDSFVCKKGMLK